MIVLHRARGVPNPWMGLLNFEESKLALVQQGDCHSQNGSLARFHLADTSNIAG